MRAVDFPARPTGVCVFLAWTMAAIAPGWPAAADVRPASPTGGGGSIVLEPVQAPAGSRKLRTVFVCKQDAVPVFSDRPCGSIVETREYAIVEPGPGQAASTLHAEPAAATRPLVRNARHEDQAAPTVDRCERLLQQRDDLDDRMRTGYSARESARLWNRWRELEAQIHASHCRGPSMR